MFAEIPASSWLVVGSHDLRSAVLRPDDWQVTLLECPPGGLIPDAEESQLYRIGVTGWPAVRALTVDHTGAVGPRADLTLDDALADQTLVPLGLLRPTDEGFRLYAHVDLYLANARFLRVPQSPSAPEKAVGDLLAATDEHFLKVGNYLCYRVKLQPDVELEHKFTLTGHPDAQALARDTMSWVAAGGLSGWIVEFREEIQSWDFLNHVYAIEEPPADAGYVSFIPTTDGRYTVKRKLFTVDTDERPELRSRGVEITDGFETHLRDVMSLTPAWNASFRRIRYDVSVESIANGNVFGIAYDRSTVIDADGRKLARCDELSQCEIEYIYSQSLAPVEYQSVRDDLAVLKDELTEYFAGRGIENYQTHESKLTFLRNQHAAV